MDKKKEYPGKDLAQRAKSAVQGAVTKGEGRPIPAFLKNAASNFGETADRAATALGDAFPSDSNVTPPAFKGSAIQVPQSWIAPPAPTAPKPSAWRAEFGSPAARSPFVDIASTPPEGLGKTFGGLPVPSPGSNQNLPQNRQFGVTPQGRGSAQKYDYGQYGTGTLTKPDGTVVDIAKHIFENYQDEDGSLKENTSGNGGKTWAMRMSAKPDYSSLFMKQQDDLFAASMDAFRRGDHPSQRKSNLDLLRDRRAFLEDKLLGTTENFKLEGGIGNIAEQLMYRNSLKNQIKGISGNIAGMEANESNYSTKLFEKQADMAKQELVNRGNLEKQMVANEGSAEAARITGGAGLEKQAAANKGSLDVANVRALASASVANMNAVAAQQQMTQQQTAAMFQTGLNEFLKSMAEASGGNLTSEQTLAGIKEFLSAMNPDQKNSALSKVFGDAFQDTQEEEE